MFGGGYNLDMIALPSELRQQDQIAENGFLGHMKLLLADYWDRWLPCSIMGDGSAGALFESLLGIMQNNDPNPDYLGVEVKTVTTPLVTLFSQIPDMPERANHVLVERFGKAAGTAIWRLNTNLCATRRTVIRNQIFSIGLDPAVGVNVLCDEGVVASWHSATIAAILTKKLSKLLLVHASRRLVDGEEWVRFRSAVLYEQPSMQAFETLLQTGRISVYFRVKGNAQRCRNRGTAFRLNWADLSKLYAISLS
jgi:hypothetical protein